MGVQDDAERFEPGSLEAWTAWLERHHDDRPGVWLVTARRATGRQPFEYDDAVVEALRYGWIDAVQRGYDEERSMLWFAPRRPTSGWSASNKARIERLEREGRLEPPGRRAVERARDNGAWTLLDDVEAMVVPPDLQAALDARGGARAAWEGFPASARKAMLLWVVQARTAPTRSRRVAEIAERAAVGERAR